MDRQTDVLAIQIHTVILKIPDQLEPIVIHPPPHSILSMRAAVVAHEQRSQWLGQCVLWNMLS